MKLTETAIRRCRRPTRRGSRSYTSPTSRRGLPSSAAASRSRRPSCCSARSAERPGGSRSPRSSASPGEFEAARAKARRSSPTISTRTSTRRTASRPGRCGRPRGLSRRAQPPAADAANYRDAVERNLAPWLDLPLARHHPGDGPQAPRRDRRARRRRGQRHDEGPARRLQSRRLSRGGRDAAEPGPAPGRWRPAPPRTGHVGPADSPPSTRR